MSTRATYLGKVIVAQAGCVAIGLLIQGHYLVTDARRHAEQAAYASLEDRANHFLAQPDLAGAAASAPEKPLMVDGAWNLVGEATTGQDRDASPLAIGTHVAWTPAADAAPHPEQLVRGRLSLPDGQHLAVACPVPPQPGFAVFHLPEAEVAVNPQTLAKSLPFINGVTGIWIGTLLGIAAYVILGRFYDSAEGDRQRSSAEALRQAQTLVRTRDAVIFGLAKLADSRDPETGEHLERISAYATTLASALRSHPKFRDQISPTFVQLIGISSALHDIGKVGIEDRILRKTGQLTPAERQQMQTHTAIGGECLEQIQRRMGRTNFLQMAWEIAVAHHERWDGKGYPQGLAGEAIPLSARIVAVADVYDALSSKRIYKPALQHARCIEMIRAGAGEHFDPVIVEAWLQIEQKFLDIARRYGPVPSENEADDGESGGPAEEGNAELEEPCPELVSAEVDFLR